MKNITYLLFTILVLLTTTCTKDFQEINTNPNSPTTVQPCLLLRQIIYDYGEEMSYEGFVAGNLLSQHFTMIDFNLFDRHDLTAPQVGGNPWPVLYTNLRDNEILLNQARSNPSATVYEGPALILKAYFAATLTDIYGDVPYFEALSGQDGNVTPKYDSQEDIYLAENGVLDNLRKAVEAIKSYNGAQALEGDILYNGDLATWINLANSLRMRYLLRVSDRIDIRNEMEAIFQTVEYILTNNQNATFDFTDGQPNNFRMATLRDGDFNLFIMSETSEEILKELNDPRMERFFRPAANSGEFKGLLNGPDASATSISVADFSRAGTIFRENTGVLDANFMTAWEVHFLFAEAAEKGLLAGDAKTYYDAAVTLAFEYWNTEIPDDYLEGAAAYNGNGDPMKQIITQKWIANMINGYEGWIEYRRTGFPKLKPIAASLNDDLIPVRMPYPTDEAALNSANYNAATVDNQNSVNAPVWWDVD